MRKSFYLAAIILAVSSHVGNVHADAIVLSQAMFSETIAEYFVEDGRVRLELEIGADDISTFRNILPDELYQRMGYGDTPLAERLPLLTSRDLAIYQGEELLPGRVTNLEPATRPQRDSLTGEPLPTPEDEAEVVLRATISYPFEGQPESLSLMAPAETGQADMGFVLYHLGVAVNDFRYLSPGFTVDLDWEDAWYSQFTQSGLRRQYYAPMTGFIYVEPYEVRKEIILRPSDIQQYIDLGLEGQTIIPAERHEDIKSRVAEFLSDKFPVSIDGELVTGTVDRVNFLNRTLRNSVVIGKQDIDLLSATMGIIYVFPTDGLPQTVEMTWDIFTEKMNRVPAASVDQAGPLTVILEPDYNVLRWENFLKFPELPTLVDVETPPSLLQQLSTWLRWLTAIVAALLLTVLLRRTSQGYSTVPGMWVACVIAAGCSAGMFYLHQQSRLDEERLRTLVDSILHNVYRAFDYHGEEVIYDVLEKSVSGDLLADVYLETQSGLELENQGGARVKVKTTTVDSTELIERNGNQLTIEGKWTVSGSVGHWGHVHERTNGYHANLNVSEVDGVWKLTGLEMLEEERL